MNKIIYYILLFLVFLYVKAEEKYVEKKTFHQVFSTSNNVTAEVHSSYGEIRYVIGASNQVEYLVEVIVDGKNEESVQRKLNSISIDFSKSGNKTIASTQFENIRVKNVNMKINYVIKIPANGSVGVAANYNDIYLPEILNEVRIASNYCDIYFNSNANKVYLQGNYGDLKVKGKINYLDLNGNYGDFYIGSVSHLECSGNYMDINIQHLEKYLDIHGNYQDFSIASMGKSDVDIMVKGNYIDGKFVCNTTMEIEINGNYTDVKYSDKYNVIRHIEKYSKLDFDAKTGSVTNSKLEVSGNYNDIILK